MPKDQQNGEIAGYSIQIEGPNTTRNIQTTGGHYTLVAEEISDLKPSTEYTFSVCAKTVVGSGPAISVSFITPQEGKASVCTLMTWCGGEFERPIFYFFTHKHIIIHAHIQLCPTLLVALKLANIIQHWHGFPGIL